MDASVPLWFGRGIAIAGASAIALAPISPIMPTASASASVWEARASVRTISPEVQLAALDLPYLLTLPVVRQAVKNWAENWVVYLGGLAKAGIGTVESLLSIPGVTREIIQEVFALNFVGAFETFTTAIRDSAVAIGEPLLNSLVWRNQKYYVVEAALRSAVPQAFLDVTNGFLVAGNVVVVSLIQGVQDLVGAVLSFNLGNIVDAVIDGTRNFLLAIGEGAGSIIDGIEAAQLGIATALATAPPPPPFSALRAPSVESTVGLGGAQSTTGPNTVTLTLGKAGAQAAESVVAEGVPAAPDELIESPKGEAEEPKAQEGKGDNLEQEGTEAIGEPATDGGADGEVGEEEIDSVDAPDVADGVTPPKDDDEDEEGPETGLTAPKDTAPGAGPGADTGVGSVDKEANGDPKRDAAA